MSRFLSAARRKPVDVTPIWLMRQAGRSLLEYRKLRERWTLAEIVAQPELCAEVTLQPVRRLGVDAAVMFADIMLPGAGMGVEFELVENVGPVIRHPIATAEDVARLRVPEGEEAAPQVIDAVRHVVAGSPVPLICFAGARFRDTHRAPHASDLRRSRADRRAAHPFRYRYGSPARVDPACGAGHCLAGLARSPRRGVGSSRPRARHPGQPRPRRASGTGGCRPGPHE